jgi:hypothetical protein
MLRDILTGVKRFILWDYPRACWQYDLMVGVILAFLFLTPRAWFRDQPRIPGANQVTALQSAHGTGVFWIDAELLTGVPEQQRMEKAARVLAVRSGRTQHLTNLEPVLDSDKEIKGYIAFARP